MKKIIAILIAVALCFTAVYAQSTIPFEVYGGVGFEMSYAKGFDNVRLSDWKWYKGSQASVLIDTEDMNGLSLPVTIHVGIKMPLIKNLDILLEVCGGVASGDAYAINADVGAKYYFMQNVANLPVKIGAGLKTGYFMYSKDVGETAYMKNSTPPVILIELGEDESYLKIYEEYPISIASSGVTFTPVVDAVYSLTKDISFGVDVGVQVGISTENKLTVKLVKSSNISESDKKKDKDGNEIKEWVVNTDEFEHFYKADSDPSNATRVTYSPSVSLTGLKANLYVSFRF